MAAPARPPQEKPGPECSLGTQGLGLRVSQILQRQAVRGSHALLPGGDSDLTCHFHCRRLMFFKKTACHGVSFYDCGENTLFCHKTPDPTSKSSFLKAVLLNDCGVLPHPCVFTAFWVGIEVSPLLP